VTRFLASAASVNNTLLILDIVKRPGTNPTICYCWIYSSARLDIEQGIKPIIDGVGIAARASHEAIASTISQTPQAVFAGFFFLFHCYALLVVEP